MLSLALLFGTAASAQLPSNSLLAYYDFVPGADVTVLYDRSGNNRHGAFATGGAKPAQLAQGTQFYAANSTYATIPASALPSGNSAGTIIVAGRFLLNGTTVPGMGLFGYFQNVAVEHNNPGIGTGFMGGHYEFLTKVDAVTAGSRDQSTHVLTWRYTPAGTLLEGIVDNFSASASSSIGTGAWDTSNGAAVGQWAAGNWLSGAVYGLAIYNRTLSNSEVTQAVSYLQTQLGGTNKLVVFDGNSATFGYNLTQSAAYPDQVMYSIRNTTPAEHYNFGATGQTTVQMSSDFDTQIAPLANGRARAVLVAWEVGNDMNCSTSCTKTPAAAVASFVSYCQHAKDSGFKVIALTVTARNSTTFNVARAAANALLRSQANPPWDYLVDLDTDPNIGPDTVATTAPNTYMQADGTHFTAAGYAKVAALAAPYLQLELASSSSATPMIW